MAENIEIRFPELSEEILNEINMRFRAYIFYKRKPDGSLDCECTHCRQKFVFPALQRTMTAADEEFLRAKHSQPGICPKCGRKIIFKALGKGTNWYNLTENHRFVVFIPDGFNRMGELDGMSVAELREKVRQANAQGEQLSLLRSQVESLKADSDAAAAAASAREQELKKQIEELRAERDKIEAKAIKEAEKEAEKKLKEKSADIIDKEVKKKLEAAKKEAAEAERESLDEQIKRLELELEAERERAEKAMKQLKVSDAHSAKASVYYKDIMESYEKMMSEIEQMPESEREKFKNAVRKALQMLLDNLEQGEKIQ